MRRASRFFDCVGGLASRMIEAMRPTAERLNRACASLREQIAAARAAAAARPS